MRPIVLGVLALGALGAADPSTLPADAAQVVAAYERAVETAKEGLRRAQDAAMKRGDVAGANAVASELARIAGKPGEATGGDGKAPAAQVRPELAIVGTWQAVWDRGTQGTNMAHETWTVNADGTCVNGPIAGKWKIGGTGWIIQWDHGQVDKVKVLKPEDVRTTAERSNGKTVSMMRK